ncbi:cytochrome c biogenesis protein CcsA [Pelosinus sp. sgz500959]|uniref:cytochrome c biogenesis protein CcsA n=1 Tax=Pelosinus sp. sgz500959 TaxID=3242472 RepID=UPI00366DF6E6
MIGYGAVFLSLIMTCIAAFFYFNLHLAKRTRPSGKGSRRPFGLIFYRLSVAFAGIAAAYLLYLILDNRFDYAYVFSYSSRALSLEYKISAFWAGQQGSFMLWLVFHVIFGVFLAQKKDTPPGVMAVYSVLQIMLLITLLTKSPFMLISQPQLDGVGLNPLLQDFWMVIHPPIIFLGYAGLAVPFAYALEGLFSNQHKNWTAVVLPWALFSWCALGAGVFIGGFWAYKVLGWGGYWAWDPVENSSLVPWLVAGALVHTLFWARLKAAAVKAAYLASIFSFVTVLYGTFLTRSGVLSDFSTHSFADEGVGGLLASFVLIALAAGLVMLIIRWPDLPEGDLYPNIESREFLLGCGVLVLSLMAVVVFIGMSTPLITMLIGNPSNVSGSFYNRTSLPLAAALVILLTVSPIFGDGKNNGSGLKQYWWLAVSGLLSLGIPFKLGLYHPIILIAIVFSVTAVIVNIMTVFNRGNLSWPAAMTHGGLALMVIGIVISSAASQSMIVTLEKQESKQAFGTNFTYIGVEEMSDGSGFYQNFEMSGSEVEKTLIRPFTKYNKDGNPSAREPGIERRLLADLYVAPVMQHEDHDHSGQEIILQAGEEQKQKDVTFKLIRAGMVGKGMGQEMRVQALLEVTKDGKTEEVKPELAYKNGGFTGVAVKAFNQYEIAINSVNPTEGKVSLDVIDRAATRNAEQVQVEISHKPFINLVWLGASLITVGCGWAAINRFRVYSKMTVGSN